MGSKLFSVLDDLGMAIFSLLDTKLCMAPKESLNMELVIPEIIVTP